MKLLVFAGSTRTQSYNRQLAKVTADLARTAGASVTLLELGSLDIPLYNADLEAQGTPPDVRKLKETMDAHPAWIICSPEYNGSYTALLNHHWALVVAFCGCDRDLVLSDAQWAAWRKVEDTMDQLQGCLRGQRDLRDYGHLFTDLAQHCAPLAERLL